MSWGFSWLYQFIEQFFSTLITILRWLADGLVWGVKAALWFVLDGFYTSIGTLVGSLDLTYIVANATGLWSGLPSQIQYLVYQTGITQGLTIIGYAIAARMLLNLIPAAFTRI